MNRDDKPLIGRYLERLRRSYTPHISIRAAADMAGITEARWRQIENGYRVAAKGIRVETPPAPADTLAEMLYGLAADPEEVRSLGFTEVGDSLARLYARDKRVLEDDRTRSDLLVSLPDEVLAAEMVRRLLAANRRFEPRGEVPELQYSTVLDAIRSAYLPESAAERDLQMRRLRAVGPETEPTYAEAAYAPDEPPGTPEINADRGEESQDEASDDPP